MVEMVYYGCYAHIIWLQLLYKFTTPNILLSVINNYEFYLVCILFLINSGKNEFFIQ